MPIRICNQFLVLGGDDAAEEIRMNTAE